jgi:type VI secretion system secreted protein Hcp
MAIDEFLKIDGVPGESLDDRHKGEIDVLAWSFGASNSSAVGSAAGGGAAKVHVQDLSVTKYVDRSSPTLMLACCTGKHIPKATLTLRKAGSRPVEFLVLELTDVLVSSVSTGGSGGEDRLTENITLAFAKFKYSYIPQKADGSADTAVSMGWDIVRNAPA